MTIVTPAGSPAFSQLYLEESDDYEVTKISGPENIPAHFNKAEEDVIIAPTNIGIKLYSMAKAQNKTFEYELGANIVFGNLYVISKEKLTLEDLQDKTVVAFGKNATPGITLRYVLSESNITPKEITYLPGGGDVQTRFIEDNEIIGLIPEPAASALEQRLSKDGIKLNRISLLEVYNSLNNTDAGFPQASIFIKKSLSKKVKDKILNDFEESAKKVTENPSAASDVAIKLGYKQPKPVIIKAIPFMNIRFVSGVFAKQALNTYFTIIINNDPEVIGTTLPGDDFYYGIKQ